MLTLAAGAAAQELNFEATTFHVVNGQDAWDGPTDADARARILSDGQRLYLEVDVTDDVIVTGPAETGSDHVAVWLALPGADGVDEAAPVAEPPPVPPVYVVADGSRAYWYDHAADVDAFMQEATSPQVVLGGNVYAYPDLATPGRRNWIKEEVDALITAPQRGDHAQEYVFFGITHYGFFPDGRPAVLYDRDRYRVIEEQIGAELGPLAEHARYTASETSGGYRIRAELPPEAFAFFTKGGLSEMSVLVDVIDMDEEGGMETLLSSSRSRLWGRPSTFERFTIRPPLSEAIYPELPRLGVGEPLEGHRHLWERLPDVYMRTDDGWAPVEREWETLYAATKRMLVELPRLQEVTFKSLFGYRKEQAAKQAVEVFHVADGYTPTGRRSFVVINGRDTLSAEHVVDVFAFRDGSPGLLTAEYAYGQRGCLSDVSVTCGCSVTSRLVLRRPLDPAWEPVPLATYSSCTKEVQVGDQTIAPDAMGVDPARLETRRTSAFGPRFAWEDVLRWRREGRQLRLDLGRDARFRFSWGSSGEDVEVERR